MRVLGLLFIFVLIQGCGGRTTTSSYGEMVANNAEGSSNGESDVRLACGSSEDCPEGIAKMNMLADNGQGFLCTGTLISSDVVLTNKHCVENIRCEDINIYLGKKENGVMTSRTERFGCKEILYSSENEAGVTTAALNNYEDIAAIKLDRASSNAPFVLAQEEGITHREVYSIFKVDHDGFNSGSISKLSCRPLERNLMSLSPSPYAENKFFAGCRTIGGNSGSPIVNNQGKLVGLVYQGGSIPLNDFSIVYNLSCLDIPSLDIHQNQSCVRNNDLERGISMFSMMKDSVASYNFAEDQTSYRLLRRNGSNSYGFLNHAFEFTDELIPDEDSSRTYTRAKMRCFYPRILRQLVERMEHLRPIRRDDRGRRWRDIYFLRDVLKVNYFFDLENTENLINTRTFSLNIQSEVELISGIYLDLDEIDEGRIRLFTWQDRLIEGERFNNQYEIWDWPSNQEPIELIVPECGRDDLLDVNEKSRASE